MHRKEIKQEETTFFICYTLDGKVEKEDLVSTITNNLITRIIKEKQLD